MDERPAIGLHRDMPEADYRSAEGLNYSLLKHMDISPMHCRQEQVAPAAATPAMELGRAFHAALLEPAVFHADYYRAPSVDRRTKVGKAKWAEALAANPGKEALKADDYDWIDAAVSALWKRSSVQALLGGKGINEASIWWESPMDGEAVLCKGRIDRLTQLDGPPFLLDVKTVPSGGAQLHAFQRDIAKYAYHVQAAYYRDGLREISDRERGFVWLAVEKEPPYAHAIFEPLPEVLEVGRAKYRRWLAEYVACAASGIWPGYDEIVQPIDLPEWVYRVAEREEGAF